MTGDSQIAMEDFDDAVCMPYIYVFSSEIVRDRVVVAADRYVVVVRHLTANRPLLKFKIL